MKVLSLMFLVFSSLSAYAISVEELLEKVNENYTNAKHIEYKASYQLFKGHKSSTVHTMYNGYIYKKDDLLYQKIDQVETISGEEYSLKISHSEKAMVLDQGTPNVQQDMDLSKVLEHCKSKEVEDKGAYYRIKLTYKPTVPTPVSVLYIRVNKKNYSLMQLDMFYAAEQDFSTTTARDMARPHLKILFKDISTKPADKSHLFALENYLKTTNNLLNPTGDCKGYYLIDNRLK